jgi:hypothetical protein
MGVPQVTSNTVAPVERKVERGSYGATAPAALAAAFASTESELIRDSDPSLSTMWLPVDLSVQLTPKERLQLAWSAARPWREWAALHALAPPPPSSWLDWSARVRTNLELYAWNYLFVALVMFIVTGLFYPWSALLLISWLLLALYMGVRTADAVGGEDASLGARMFQNWPGYIRYILLGGLLTLMLFLTDVVALALTSASLAAAVTLAHAALHDPVAVLSARNAEYTVAP